MPLNLIEVNTTDISVQRKIESLGKEVAVITIEVITPAPKTSSPFHWRSGGSPIPPLDISVEPSTGAFRKMKFLFPNEPIQRLIFPIPDDAQAGLPIFNTQLWSNGMYYLDEPEQVQAVFSEDALVFAINNNQETRYCVRLGDSLEFIFNEKNNLTGIRAKEITNEELQALQLSHLIS